MNTSSIPTPISPSFKIYSALPYLLVVALSFILCFGFCRFVTNQAVSNNVAITKSISTSVLVAEHYIGNNLKSANSALSLYLKNNKFPSPAELDSLAKTFHVDGYNIFDKDGYRVFKSSNKRPVTNRDSFNILEARPSLSGMLKSLTPVDKLSSLAFHNSSNSDGVKTAGIMFDVQWSPYKKMFLNAYVKTPEITKMLKDGVSKYSNVENIKILSPSGTVMLNTSDIGSAGDAQTDRNTHAIGDYSEEPIVRNNISNIEILLPFGGLQDAETYRKDSAHKFTRGQANDAGQYFYVMNVTFDKTELNKQLAIIITVFIALTLCACMAIYYINKSISQSSHLADLSERTADKVTHLCNTRLGEVRRYITKIVGDSMRTKNMNKDLPEEMVELLDRAFREVDERDLLVKKNEDV